MKIADKIVVVTGAASGIGRALARRFHAEGARHIVCADLNAEGARATAEEIGGTWISTNVGVEADIVSLIESTEEGIGPIDLFCSNAGIGVGPELDSPNEEWQASWDVNVMAHVYAARHLVPRMVSRGSGYFMHTASAAGLLNQIGGAAYGVTKHASVGFGEWLALTYRHEGIGVSMLCPQAVRTPMTETDNPATAAAAGDGMIEPEELAECVIEGLAEERFLILPHADVATYMQRKTADYDRWISGMNRLHRQLTEAE
jgi:NAD(P)-dependent dehydrogenase (short-subunit alcohol dehydrogenase family)